MTPSDQTELRQKLQLLKGSNGEYVLSTITDLYALVDFIAEAEQRAVIALVEGLVDAQDQEADLDGRAVGQPYHILCGNDREYLEYVLLPQLKAELEHSLRKEQE